MESRTDNSPFAQIQMEIQDKGAGLNGLVIVRHNVLVIVPVVFIVLIVKIASLVRIVLRKGSAQRCGVRGGACPASSLS